MNIHQLLFSFDGRIGRRDFWIVTVVMFGLSSGFQQVFGSYGPDNPMTIGPAIITLGWFVLALWIVLAVQVKRWHDLGKSGWWALINLVPVVGAVWVLVECGFFPGTESDNQYGPAIHNLRK